MALLGKIITAPLKALGLISTPAPAAALPAPLPTVTRDDAVAAQERDDELRRRQGGAADIITGSMGAQAPTTGGKLTLGS